MTSVTARDLALRLPRETMILAMSHENPDGDALGCVVGLGLMARQLGIPFRMYIPGDGILPPEYSFLPLLSDIERGAFPEVEHSTTAYIMDCATGERLDPKGLECVGACINVDHHQDNRSFGSMNLLDFEATSTTQILYDIFRAGGFELTPEIATALYVGLVTDSGRFQYSNTTPAAHRVAAALVEAGVDVSEVNRRLFETTPLAKLLLQGRALEHLEIRLEGKLAMAWVDVRDFETSGADESLTEGIIDTLRRIEGISVAAFMRERKTGDGLSQKVSLRSTDGAVNVADIAHTRGGGGHVRAAGANVDGDPGSVMDWIEREVEARL